MQNVKQQRKIQCFCYDRESKVFSVEVKKIKSVDSDLCDNIVIDYNKNGGIVRINLYDFSFEEFKENKAELKSFARDRRVAITGV